MIIITPKAAEKLKILIAEENKNANISQTAGLRLHVQGGGCSGFQYGLLIEKEPDENDKTFESSGIKIFIDPISIRYLAGVEIDFEENKIMGGGFKINNPNAKGTCGCGSSFEPK
ncbi:MAG: iron-sulfur cluster assembly accessory protein [Patescibacteria group bacterium]